MDCCAMILQLHTLSPPLIPWIRIMDDSLTGMFDLAQHTITTHPMLSELLFYGFNYRVLCPSASNTSSCQFTQGG